MKTFLKNYLLNSDYYFSQNWKDRTNLNTFAWVIISTLMIYAASIIVKQPTHDISDYCAILAAFYMSCIGVQPAVLAYRQINKRVDKILFHTHWILLLTLIALNVFNF